MFASRGFDDVTVDEIAAWPRFASTFYRYLRPKKSWCSARYNKAWTTS
jgi:hypothetical protein